jgi:hypothetical protein
MGNASVFSVAREVLRNGSGDSSFAVSHRYVILCTRFTLASGATSASMDRVRYPVSRPLGNSNSIFQGGHSMKESSRHAWRRVQQAGCLVGRRRGNPVVGRDGKTASCPCGSHMLLAAWRPGKGWSELG